MTTPKLRFKADDGSAFPAWEQMSLEEACELNPKSGPLADEFYYMDLSNVDSGQWLEPQLIQKSNAPSRAKRVALIDDVFFQSVRPYNKGHYHFTHPRDKQVVASTGFIQARMRNGCNSFLYQLFFEDGFNEEVNLRCTGSNYPAINTTDFGQITTFFPTLPEQRKIAGLLSAVDEVIAQQQAEVAAWERRKLGVAQKLFVQEVRFKADDGSDYPNWKRVRIGDIGCFIGGLTFNSSDIVEADGLAVLTSTNISSDGSLDYEHNVQLVAKAARSYQYLKPNDIVICKSNGSQHLVGKAAKYDGGYQGPHGITVGAFCGIFRSTSPIIPFWFQSEDYQRLIKSSRQGGKGSLSNITGSDIENHYVILPSSQEEQRKIADCLGAIDDVIALAKAELEKWRELKKGLLQQLFV